jgi:exodeoxyribonuclease VII small subunit
MSDNYNESQDAEKSTPDFTTSMKTIESILSQFKSGSLSLEDSLKLFESGIGHLKICQEKLTTARGKVEELVQTMQEGGLAITKPFQNPQEAEG